MKLKTNIFLVRHGETEWNKQKIFQGNKDSSLTVRGIKQAYRVKRSLEDFEIDLAYASPLKRARDTAEIILEDREVEVIPRDNLREIKLGPWEGKRYRAIAHSFPDEYAAFWERPDLFNLPGAETFQELQDRMAEEIESIFANEKTVNVLVVSHGIAIKVLLAHYSSLPLSRLSEITNPVNGGFFCLAKSGDES